MPEQHKKILAALGLAKEQIEAIEAITPDQAKDFKIEDFVETVKYNFQTQFLNDDGFLEGIPEERTSKTVKKNIESAQYARFMNEMKDVAKELNIDFADLSAENQKSLKGFYRETFKKGLTKAGNTQALVELQDKLSQALADKTNLETTTEKRVSDAIAAESKKYGAKLEKSAINSMLANVKGLTVKPEYISEGVLNKVKERFTPVFNPETMAFDLKKKDNPVLDVLKADGKKQTFNEVVMDILKEDELWKEPAAGAAPPPTQTIQVNGDSAKPVVPDYILKNMRVGLAEEVAK